MQRDFETARGDLHRAGKARCGRVENGEALRRQLAGLGHLLDEGGRGRFVSLDYECGAFGIVVISEFLE